MFMFGFFCGAVEALLTSRCLLAVVGEIRDIEFRNMGLYKVKQR